MRGLFINNLGACSCAPFKVKQEPTTAGIIAAAGISALASGAGSYMSSTAASNLNDVSRDYDRKKTQWLANYNSEQAALAHERQKELLSNEQNWNEKMYNLYNSPSAMRRQYEQAGYNPYLVSSQGLQGSSLGSPSAPSAPQANAPSTGQPSLYMPDYSMMSNGITSAANMLLQGQQVQANVANTSVKTLKEAAEAYSTLRQHGMSDSDAQKLVMPYFKGSQGMNANSDLFFNNLNLEYQRGLIAKDRESLEQQIYSEFGRTEKADKVMLMEQEFDRVAKEIGYYASLGKLNEAKIEEIASSISRNIAAAGLDKANNELLRRSMNHLVEQAKYEASLQKTNSQIQEGEYTLRKPIYEAASTGAGQTAEQIDYYADKIIDKVGKIGKINIGFGYNTSKSYVAPWQK